MSSRLNARLDKLEPDYAAVWEARERALRTREAERLAHKIRAALDKGPQMSGAALKAHDDRFLTGAATPRSRPGTVRAYGPG